VHDPADLQVQPMHAAAALLQAARAAGARVTPRAVLERVERDRDGVRAVRTPGERIACRALVNAAGAWSGEVAALAGARLDIRPRRGFVLVTEPLPPTVFHKVYTGEYMGDVASSAADLQTSPVVEGTQSGTVLIGASRELAGFEATLPVGVLARLAAGAVRLFPLLERVRVMRAYRGFRPFSPDHLPVIGPDPEVPGLWHACGHEGAGICLAPATAELVVAGLTSARAPVDAAPFDPARL
jgi:glycine/D-amino acid oxidase-like deaminating enzyme